VGSAHDRPAAPELGVLADVEDADGAPRHERLELRDVDLGSAQAQVGDSSDPAVVALVSGPTTSAAAMGTCVPGGGCGTVTAAFRALAPGRATITASRTTCGEAMRCTGTDGAWEVTVVVGG
jgi:hypothetical protein